jgi:hypothetical protein
VDRQNRQARRNAGKSDPLDAVEAARAALSGKASGRAKSRDGWVEALRVLLVAKRSARSAPVKALTQMRRVIYSAPDELRRRFEGLSISAFVSAAPRGVFGQGHPAPAQPRREPPGELHPVAHRDHPACFGSRHPGLHGATGQRGSVQA